MFIYKTLISLFCEPECVFVHVLEEKLVITGMIMQTQDCTILLWTSRVSSALCQISPSSNYNINSYTNPVDAPHTVSATPPPTNKRTNNLTAQPTHHTSAKIQIKVCLNPLHLCKWNLQETALPRSHLYNSSFPSFSGLMFHNREIAIWTI